MQRLESVRCAAAIGLCLMSWGLAHAQSLERQDICAVQARKAYQEWQQDEWNQTRVRGVSRVSSEYRSHYNIKLQKCLILIELTSMVDKSTANSAILMDAYERRPYASYLSFSDKPTPMSCELIPSLQQKKYCSTREEFDAFVASYLEE